MDMLPVYTARGANRMKVWKLGFRRNKVCPPEITTCLCLHALQPYSPTCPTAIQPYIPTCTTCPTDLHALQPYSPTSLLVLHALQPHMPYMLKAIQPYLSYMSYIPTALHAIQPYMPYSHTALQPSVADGYYKYATLIGLRTELLPAAVANNH